MSVSESGRGTFQKGPAGHGIYPRDISSPANRRDRIRFTEEKPTSKNLLIEIENLPDKVYTNDSDINKELEKNQQYVGENYESKYG